LNEEKTKSAEELKKTIISLLGKDSNPHLTKSGNISIFGRTDYTEKLNEGQRVLLIMAVALHAKGTQLKEALIFLDEPENHLHPAAVIEIIKTLKEHVTEGQIWIATHSVTLLAHLYNLNPNCLWYVKDHQITHAGKKSREVLDSLLGGSDGISELMQFCSLPAQLATYHFLSQCLQPPEAVGAKIGDPQQAQMAAIIFQKIQSNTGLIRILDYGAGQGRLITELRNNEKLNGLFDYIAFDTCEDNRAVCEKEIIAALGSSDNRYFNDLSLLKEKYLGSIDIVVMCNTLHEISPDKWLATLGTSSPIYELLRNNGHLLIVEDQQIPIGEKAHNYGFLVPDVLAFHKLLNIDHSDKYKKSYIVNDASIIGYNHTGRLKAHMVAKDLLSRISDNSVKKAIRQIKQYASLKLKDFLDPKKAEFNHSDGRLYGFWVSQYANASLWLESRGM